MNNGVRRYASQNEVLTKINTIEYNPTEDYHPATKKYVDNAGYASETFVNERIEEEAFYKPMPIDSIESISNTAVYYYINLEDLEDKTSYYFNPKEKENYPDARIHMGRLRIKCDDGSFKVVFSVNANTTTTYVLYKSYEKKWYFRFDNNDVEIDFTDSSVPENIIVKRTYNAKYLSIGNNAEYTPTSDYSPATKKYVDDSISTITPDETLSIQGASADAKAVGEALELKANKDDIVQEIVPITEIVNYGATFETTYEDASCAMYKIVLNKDIDMHGNKIFKAEPFPKPSMFDIYYDTTLIMSFMCDLNTSYYRIYTNKVNGVIGSMESYYQIVIINMTDGSITTINANKNTYEFIGKSQRSTTYNEALIYFANKNSLDTNYSPSADSDITTKKYVDGSVTDSILSSLANYYLKSETYSQAEVNELVSSIPKFEIDVVDVLPTENISTTTVYLLTTGDESQNLYTEYIYVNDIWEKLGTQTLDLSVYALSEDIGYLNSLTTLNKDTIVDAINEINEKTSQTTVQIFTWEADD